MARRATGSEAERLFREACAKYEQAVAIKPDDHEALDNWGNTLLEMAKVAEPPIRESLFEQAAQKLIEAEKVRPGTGAYNLACVYALLGRAEPAEHWLRQSYAHKSLPTRSHLEADTDLDPVRHLPWFAEILALAEDGR